VETIVKPQLLQHLTEATKSIDDDRKLYIEHKQRLISVREEKQRKILNPPEDDDDTFSDTSSLNSQSSRNTARTFRTSKTKRKHERKLMNLKEGNKFEDVALVDSIWKLVQKIIAVENQNMIRELLVAGVELKFDEAAKDLQVSNVNYKRQCQQITIVFPEILQGTFAAAEAHNGRSVDRGNAVGGQISRRRRGNDAVQRRQLNVANHLRTYQ
jgi:elongator complex protein 1